MTANLRPYSLALLLALSGPALADNWGLGIYYDQDQLIPFFNEDRDYTMGVAVEVFNQPAQGVLDLPVDWAKKWLGRLAPPEQAQHSLLFGSINYTPDNLSASAPILNDRPYASVLYLSNKRVYGNRREGSAVGLEAQVGVLGTYVAREVQRRLHRWWRDTHNTTEPVDPRGWHNQISSGGEPTLRFRIAHSQRLLQSDQHVFGKRYYDLAAGWDASLGYQTNASVGLAGRLGLIDSAFWTLPYDPINRGNFLPSFDGDEIYLWAAYRLRGIAYDALLQGQFGHSTLTYDGGDLERLVHEGGVGITGAWRWLQLTLSANAKTAELRNGQANRTHVWGGAYLMVRW